MADGFAQIDARTASDIFGAAAVVVPAPRGIDYLSGRPVILAFARARPPPAPSKSRA